MFVRYHEKGVLSKEGGLQIGRKMHSEIKDWSQWDVTGIAKQLVMHHLKLILTF